MNSKERILNWVARKKPGTAFSARDLPMQIPRGMRDVMLSRLAAEGVILRLMRGIYAKPRYSELLKKNVAPGGDEVAMAIARKFGWTIMPCDDAAINGLGLSTQVPCRHVYISDGPSKKYKFGQTNIEFKRRCRRETSMASRESRMVIRAMKGLGREYADDEIVARISSRYSLLEWKAICEQAGKASEWIGELLWNEYKRRSNDEHI